MERLTPRNGGDTPINQVADAWKKEDHDFGWSQYDSDKWAVQFAKEIQEEEKHGLMEDDSNEDIR